MMNRNGKIALAVAAVAVIIAVITGVLMMRGGESASTQASPSDETSPAQPPASPAAPSAPLDGGAAVGNQQRSWPDMTGQFDDSPHTTPGKYSVDQAWGRPVWTPINHEGDLPSTSDLVNSMQTCSDPGGPVLSGKTQQQYVNARFLVVNNEAGPSEMNKGVPRGYAHSPQGAVIAAINQGGYGISAQGDEVGEEVDAQLWSTSKQVQEQREFLNLPYPAEGMAMSRPQTMFAATGYKVVTCSPEVMVVEVIYQLPDFAYSPTSEGHVVIRVPLVWRDGDWHADFGGMADDQQARSVHTTDGFTSVVYQ